MNKRFNARVYAEGAIVTFEDVGENLPDYYETKKEAINAIEKVLLTNIKVVGGEVLRLKDGHYRTVFSCHQQKVHTI